MLKWQRPFGRERQSRTLKAARSVLRQRRRVSPISTPRSRLRRRLGSIDRSLLWRAGGPGFDEGLVRLCAAAGVHTNLFQTSRRFLALLAYSWVRQDSKRQDCRGVIAFADAGANSDLLLELAYRKIDARRRG